MSANNILGKAQKAMLDEWRTWEAPLVKRPKKELIHAGHVVTCGWCEKGEVEDERFGVKVKCTMCVGRGFLLRHVPVRKAS